MGILSRMRTAWSWPFPLLLSALEPWHFLPAPPPGTPRGLQPFPRGADSKARSPQQTGAPGGFRRVYSLRLDSRRGRESACRASARRGGGKSPVGTCPGLAGAARTRRRSRHFCPWPAAVAGAGCGGPGGSVSWHQVAVGQRSWGGASLVEEVGLEGGRQRQRGDGTQPLLPQGQAHRATAEIHERQGLSWESQREKVSDSVGGPKSPSLLSTAISEGQA